MAPVLGRSLDAALQQMKGFSKDELVQRRYDRLMNYGQFNE
jgi:acetyl-CoA carboxylase alpha subunit